jgi:hypothetical protein
MTQYLLLLHECPADAADISPAEVQEIIARYKAWSQRMAEAGKLVDGWKLADDGGRGSGSRRPPAGQRRPLRRGA